MLFQEALRQNVHGLRRVARAKEKSDELDVSQDVDASVGEALSRARGGTSNHARSPAACVPRFSGRTRGHPPRETVTGRFAPSADSLSKATE
jgi:hypothetical protein